MTKNNNAKDIAAISDITPDSKNANKGTQRGRGLLEKSLRQYGAGRSIVVDKGGYVIGGNKTIDVAADLGLPIRVVETDGEELVVVQRTDLDIDSAAGRGLAIADNRASEASLDWDTEMLLELSEGGNIDLTDFWKPEELEEMLGEWGDEPATDPGAQIDRADELRQKWGVESGQLWSLGEHRLICGDCTDADVVARLMDGEKAQLGITSPPYAVGKEYEAGVTFAEHLQLLRGFANRVLQAIEAGGFMFINFDEIAAQSHAAPMTGSKRHCIYPISKDYWKIFHEERGCDLYAQRVWYKPFNRLQQPFWSYKTSTPHPQEWEHIWTWRLPGGDGDKVQDWDISVRAVWDTRNESTDDKPLTRHVAAFPVGIPERAMKAHSSEYDLIYEPFSGSGTTLVVSERLGRKCRAVEIAPGYVGVALERWAQMTGKQPQLN